MILGMLLLACSSPTSTTAPTQAQVPIPDPSLQTGSLSGGDSDSDKFTSRSGRSVSQQNSEGKPDSGKQKK